MPICEEAFIYEFFIVSITFPISFLGKFVPDEQDELELVEVSCPFHYDDNFFENFQAYFLARNKAMHLTRNPVFDFDVFDSRMAPMFWYTVKYSSTLLVTELIVSPHVVSNSHGIPKIFLAYRTAEDREWVLYKEHGTVTVNIFLKRMF